MQPTMQQSSVNYPQGDLFVYGPSEWVDALGQAYYSNGKNLELARATALNTVSTKVLLKMARDCLERDPAIDWVATLITAAALRGAKETISNKLNSMVFEDHKHFRGNPEMGLNLLVLAAEVKHLCKWPDTEIRAI